MSRKDDADEIALAQLLWKEVDTTARPDLSESGFPRCNEGASLTH